MTRKAVSHADTFPPNVRAIKPVADEAPGVAAVRELAGLAAYRSGRWREASRHLNAYGALSDSTEHLPVLMDCQRALHKPKKVAELWGELRQSSPDPDVLAEGRIVVAASLADSGDLNGAIAMLATAGASKALRNPSDRHLRQWYLLADLYERAGDHPGPRVLRADHQGRPRGLRRGRAAPRPGSRAPVAAQGEAQAEGQVRLEVHPQVQAALARIGPARSPGRSGRCGRRRRRGAVVVVGGAVVVVAAGAVVVVDGGAVPKSGPMTVTSVPMGVRGQTSAASA